MRFVETSQERELYGVQIGLRRVREHRMPEAGRQDLWKRDVAGATVGREAA